MIELASGFLFPVGDDGRSRTSHSRWPLTRPSAALGAAEATQFRAPPARSVRSGQTGRLNDHQCLSLFDLAFQIVTGDE